MARNWSSLENPPRRWRRKPPESRQEPPGAPIYLFDGLAYVPLRQLPQRVKETICEAVEKFSRLHAGA